MPLDSFQLKIRSLIAKNRNAGSYFAGGTLIHEAENSPRFSKDFDLFHDEEDALREAIINDRKVLHGSGLTLRMLREQGTFFQGIVEGGEGKLLIDWAVDSPWRFFPLVKDHNFGHRLHPFDAATNKVLAAASRREPRDYIDLIYLHENYLKLGTLIWAACGKDPGMTPDFIVQQVSRFSHYRREELDVLSMAIPIDLVSLSRRWYEALEEAKEIFAMLPTMTVGSAFLDHSGKPIDPTPRSNDFSGSRRLESSVGGVGSCTH